MPTNQNSASRLHSLFSAASKETGTQPTAKAWANVFGMKFEDTPAGYGRVARMLALVSEELEAAHRQMRSTQYSPETYEPVFNRLRLGIGLDQLRSNWKGPQARLQQGDTLTMLKLYSEMLPDEGRAVPPEALDELNQLLADLETLVAEEDLPGDLRNFILQQTDIIRRALQEYPIVGERAFERAVGDVLMRVPEYQEMFKRHREHKAMGLLEKAWGHVLTWSTRVSALRDLVSAGEGLAGLLSSGGQQ